MMTTYGFFAGTELWNHERLMSYLQGNIASGFCGLRSTFTSINPNCYCATSRCLNCDQGSGPNGEYISPILDDAPWYDPDIPESAEFAGLFVEDITGFDGTVARDISDGAISGSSLGPLRLKGRSITVTGWLRSKTCCGAEYGLRWLQEALMGTNGCDNCALGDLYMIKCCPPETDTCHIRTVSDTRLANELPLGFKVVDQGGGLYQIWLDDTNSNNVVAIQEGTYNNDLGFVPVAFEAQHTWKLSFTLNPGSIAVSSITVPWDIITNFDTAPVGLGRLAVIDVDTTITSDCEDEQAQITTLAAALDLFVTTYGSDNAQIAYPLGLGRELEVVEGINPLDYVRLFHRTGLTDGVKVIDRSGSCCTNCGCTNLKVQFTLTSELPYIFSDITWCADTLPFPDDEYCLNLRSLCGQCNEPIGTTAYARQVARPECGVVLRHNQTWCADGWDMADGCPPANCKLALHESTAFAPVTDTVDVTDPACAAGETGASPDICEIGLLLGGAWYEVGGWNVADGFPPKFCTLKILGGDVCAGEVAATDTEPLVPAQLPCLISVTYNECTGVRTWVPIRWDGVVPKDDVACPCIEIAETCIIKCPDSDVLVCPDPRECPINLNCDGTWQPIGWTFDQNLEFPAPDCAYLIQTVNGLVPDNSPITEYVDIPSDEFIADCGPIPVPPPLPLIIQSVCYCEPWVTKRMCCTLTNPGDWNDATTYIEIYTGSAEMRRLKIEAFQNPFGENAPCPCDPNDPFWECRQPCASITIPQLPPSSTLIIDSRLHIAQLILASGKIVNAMRYIFTESGASGAPFSWFELGQCSTFCIVAAVDAMFVADDATLKIGMVTRYLASGW